MKTFIPKIDPNQRKWWVVDVKDQVLGRAAVTVAKILRGKDKPIFTPHLDTGDHVVVLNARGIRVTGKNKPRQMAYFRFSGYPGGLRRTAFEDMLATKPEEAFRLAVKRMLPKNRLGRKMLKKLHVYADASHHHQAQKPETFKL